MPTQNLTSKNPPSNTVSAEAELNKRLPQDNRLTRLKDGAFAVTSHGAQFGLIALVAVGLGLSPLGLLAVGAVAAGSYGLTTWQMRRQLTMMKSPETDGPLRAGLAQSLGEEWVVVPWKTYAQRVVPNRVPYLSDGECTIPQRHAQIEQHIAELSAQAGLKTPPRLVVGAHRYMYRRGQGSFMVGAIGKDGQSMIVAAEPALDLFTDREMRAVLAHEIAHIQQKHVNYSVMSAGKSTALRAVTMLGLGATLLGFIPGAAAVAALFFGATLFTMGKNLLGRQHERRADLLAVRFSRDPIALASALEKLEAISRLSGGSQHKVTSLLQRLPVVNLLFTHPHTPTRVARLRRMAKKLAPYVPNEQGVVPHKAMLAANTAVAPVATPPAQSNLVQSNLAQNNFVAKLRVAPRQKGQQKGLGQKAVAALMQTSPRQTSRLMPRPI